MDQDLALIILATCIKSSRDIGDLAHLISADDFEIKIGIASSIHHINEQIIDVIFDRFPCLRNDMDRRLENFGRYI